MANMETAAIIGKQPNLAEEGDLNL